jgi:hypothetical protein
MLSLREREIREILDEDQKYNRVRFENEKKNAAINNITYSPPKKFEKAVAFEMNKYFIKIQAAIDKAINDSTEQNFLDIVEAYRLTVEYIDAYANKRGLVQRDISKIEDKFDSISNSINHVVDLCRERNFIFTLKKLENIKNNIDQRIYSYTDIRTTPRDFLSTGAPTPISTTLRRPISEANLDSALYFDVDTWNRSIPSSRSSTASRSLSGWDGTESESTVRWDEDDLSDYEPSDYEPSEVGSTYSNYEPSEVGSTYSNTSRFNPSTTSSTFYFPPAPEFPQKLPSGRKKFNEVKNYSREQFENYIRDMKFTPTEEELLRTLYNGHEAREEEKALQQAQEALQQAPQKTFGDIRTQRVEEQRAQAQQDEIIRHLKALQQAQSIPEAEAQEELTATELFNKRKEEARARALEAQEEAEEEEEAEQT